MAKYLLHSRGLASRRIGAEEVIVSPRAGMVWSLNPAGALVWELADGSMELAEMAGVLAASRGLAAAAAAEEIEDFAQRLEGLGLVEWRELPGAPGARSRQAAAEPPAGLAAPPDLLHEERLQVLAAACDSNHSGQGAACMLLGSCASGFS
jgi:hypothetical protein